MRAVNPSDIVRSLAGRDRGKLFFVLETDGEYAALADGKVRKLKKPKRKKLKHMEFVARGDAEFEFASDNGMRKALAAFSRLREETIQDQGGKI